MPARAPDRASAIERAIANGWTYDCECPEAGVGWTRLKRTRKETYGYNGGIRVDFDYVAPDGKRFRSLVGARSYPNPNPNQASAEAAARGLRCST